MANFFTQTRQGMGGGEAELFPCLYPPKHVQILYNIYSAQLHLYQLMLHDWFFIIVIK